ncbi:adenine-specific DNA methylase containing a Zn-ribbon [Frankia torreyi]|uniref:Adenine-specific DNA methylase containing a Zn-ribbon n=1 Tax=Frankia torreyi TaxID=1856 RepID=A0A0D8B5X0_9ACTN|nr:DUF1156 domain-containing protein [Frankia torreyi]KJE19505.1 adenine-specific DNA methylase containing a Zn-ribbon [Frankia torreyi]
MLPSTTVTPHVLAEDWLPVAELGVESRRERAAASALPPLSFLHVWWARRPLVASAAVVLAGLLPAWSKDLAEAFPDTKPLADEHTYRQWLLHMVGIWGDPIAARKAYDEAVANKRRIPNPYTYKQAFRNHPDRENLNLLAAVLSHTWGEAPLVADLTAGGGSIPFAAARLGMRTFANDLNGVAACLLRAGVQFPAQFGLGILPDLQQWGGKLVGRVQDRISRYFPSGRDGQVLTYIWAQAVACPRTGKTVPLVPDWSLRTDKGKEIAVRLVTHRAGQELDEPEFEVVEGAAIDFDPRRGTVRRGDGLSPWDGQVIDESYIKDEAQAGRMTQVLYAVAVRPSNGKRSFRIPTEADLHGFRDAESALNDVATRWALNDVIPVEELAEKGDRGRTSRPRLFGITTFAQMFSSRQLLVHGIFVEEFRVLAAEVHAAMPADRAQSVLTLLGVMQGKALDYNAKSAAWHQSRQTIAHVFTRHDFSFKWSFAEFEGTALYKWALDQLLDSFGGLARLLHNTGVDLATGAARHRDVSVTQGNAADVRPLADGSVAHLCMDPPYYDNVMYAELSDFFYVWEKRTIGRISPDLFPTDTADAENEAVANASRFVHMGRRMRELADADYEAKMTAIFAEAHRVLRDDGVLTVMFTHKRAEAWDTLGMGLLQAGFTIETSWPINTEAEHSLHQSGVNSAASTIMLVCRKRAAPTPGRRRTYWEDIEAEVRQTARDAVTRFRADGIDGVDLLLSAYGPTLGVVSRHWPVYSSTADENGRARLLRPEDALTVARAEIVRVQRARLVGRPVEFDALTDFTVAYWDMFKGPLTTFDDARRLALAVGGLDLDELQRAKILEKKAGMVTLQPPGKRLRTRGADPDLPGVRVDAESFLSLVDAVHTACHIAEEDGLGRAKMFLERTGLIRDSRFTAVVQALVNTVPRTKVKDDFVLSLAKSLDRLVAFCMHDVLLPEEEHTTPKEQGDLFLGIAT